MEVKKKLFGEFNGQKITSYTIRNANRMEVTCIDYGCIITEIMVSNKQGIIENVVLGFDTLEEYIHYSPYFGSIIGRVAGRIGQSEFELDGITHHLPENEGKNHLHGGPKGFHHVIWESFIEEKADEASIIFSYTSPDGEAGYPGNLKVDVKYTINNNNEIVIAYKANTDKKTLVNLTNHSYFNLSGNLRRNILEHELKISSDQFLELDQSLLPTGKFMEVADTAFDLRKGKKILEAAESDHPQNKLVGGGYDHPFLLNANTLDQISLSDSFSGRKLVVQTDLPSVVVYTSNMLEGNFQIRGNSPEKHLGICLETQLPPDAMNHPEFPSIVLDKNETYQSKTSYRFTLV
ncbi:aldose epimerase family protein [Niallia sp. NCCP-28]|uniref:aldose epimerase family protein n=1 Tax=Niallia sp. NCCP-28 TaxID=2934712 RepID=UPI00207F8CB4|nr:aldose epimerase family protein [Niallia sp. NCCP-28]GKU81865.1 aldose 1-epimerase [Niallia sp. NCCP-28]